MSYYPNPTFAPGSAGYNPYNNWLGSGANTDTNNQFDIRIDQRFTEKTAFYARYSQATGTYHNWNCFGNAPGPLHARAWDRRFASRGRILQPHVQPQYAFERVFGLHARPFRYAGNLQGLSQVQSPHHPWASFLPGHGQRPHRGAEHLYVRRIHFGERI